jgi:prepilin-type N-terminal cleavage/methylation domain-containing protein
MRSQRGFTLLEALVAVMILGGAVAAISGVLSTSLRNIARAEDYERVTLLARAQMNELLALPPWKDGNTWSGQWAGDYHWKAQAQAVPTARGAQESARVLVRMTLVGVWKTTRGEKTYTLETARVQSRNDTLRN